jgi:hypothetical protein
MDGIKACNLIENQLNRYFIPKHKSLPLHFINFEELNPSQEMCLSESERQFVMKGCKPIIYALTGDCNPDKVKEIMKHPFKKVFQQFTPELIEQTLKILKDRKEN